MIWLTHQHLRIFSRIVLVASLPLIVSVACADDNPLSPVAAPSPRPAGVNSLFECEGFTRGGDVKCQEVVAGSGSGARLALLGQNQIKLRSSNVRYDTTSLIFGFDVQVQNLLAEPIGTADGVTVTGMKVFYETGPNVTAFVVPYDTGTIRVSNADGVQRFTRANQPYHLYPQILPPQDSTPKKRWEWKVPRSVESFAFTLRVFTSVPSEPRIDTSPPDSIPEAMFAPENLGIGMTGLAGRYVRNTISILFMPGAGADERQAALDVAYGRVIGGARMPDGDGLYYVEIPKDSTAATILRVTDLLNGMPQVAGATAVFAEAAEEELDYLRPNDGPGWERGSWNVDSLSTTGLRWGLEAIRAPLAWGCETGDPATMVAVIDHGFHPESIPDIQKNLIRAHNPLQVLQGGHGDLTSSVLAARGNDSARMTGVMWKAGLHLIESSADAGGRSWVNSRSQIISLGIGRQIGLAASVGARVISISQGMNWSVAENQRIYGGTPTADMVRRAQHYSNDVRRWLRHLGGRGSYPLLVFSAGNEGYDARWNGYPQLVTEFPDQVLVVGAAGLAPTATGGYRNGAFMRDPNTNYGPLVQIAAPASGVGSINARGVVVARGQTSIATPFVSGVAGLLFSFDPRMSSRDAKDAILQGARAGGQWVDNGGAQDLPVLNAHEALRAAAQNHGAPVCGNRVWIENGAVSVRRVRGGVEVTEALYNPGGPVSDVNVFHGGKWISFFDPKADEGTGRYRYIRWTRGLWDERPPPQLDEFLGPVETSRYGESHDRDAVVWTDAFSTHANIVHYDYASGQETVITTIPLPPDANNYRSECIRMRHETRRPDPVCVDSIRAGSGTGTYTSSPAFSPRGDRVIVAVQFSSARADVNSWSDCPWQPPPPPVTADTTTPNVVTYRCRGYTHEGRVASSTIYSAPAAPNSLPMTIVSVTGQVSALTVSDGGEREFTDERAVRTNIESFRWTEENGRNVLTPDAGGTLKRAECHNEFRRQSDGALLFSRDGCASSFTMAPIRIGLFDRRLLVSRMRRFGP